MSLLAILFFIELEVDSKLDSPCIEHCGYQINSEEWCYREFLGS